MAPPPGEVGAVPRGGEGGQYTPDGDRLLLGRQRVLVAAQLGKPDTDGRAAWGGWIVVAQEGDDGSSKIKSSGNACL